MKTICPECKHTFPVPAQFVGRTVKCPQCREPMEISKTPRSPLVKFLQSTAIFITFVALLGFSVWVLMTHPNAEQLNRAVESARTGADKKRLDQLQKTALIIADIQAELDMATTEALSATEEALSAAEEAENLRNALTLATGELKQKEQQITIMMDELGSLNETVASEAERKRKKQESNLLQALTKGSDVWSLAGLTGTEVIVLIEGAPDDSSLSSQQLNDETVLLMQQNGIEVFSAVQVLQVRGRPRLEIHIVLEELDTETNTFIANIDIELKQTVVLGRDSTILCADITTWNRAGWTKALADDDLQDVRDKITDYLSQFVSDYYSANPIDLTR